MAIKIWKKPRILRTYSTPVYQNGYIVENCTDQIVMLDIQTMSDTQRTTPEGDRPMQRIKTFGDAHIQIAHDGIKADKVYFQGLWFECVASRLSENTVIRHWTSEFVECLDQPDPPTIGGGATDGL